MTDDTINETIVSLFAALEMLPEPQRRDEPIREAIERAPVGHPAREIMSRTVKCNACGSLMPFYQLGWVFEDGRMAEPYCRNCSSSDMKMWKPAVAGHA
jgi:hypothetical protein